MHTNSPKDWTIWLLDQRRIIINILSGLMVVLGGLGVAYSFFLVSRADRTPSLNFYIYLGAYVIVVTLFAVRRIPDLWRSVGFTLLLYGFALYAFYSGWLAGGGRPFMLALVTITAVLINPRIGFFVAFLSVLTYIFFGLAFSLGWIPFAPLPDPTTAEPIIIEGIGFSMSVLLIAGSMWFFGRALMAADQSNQAAQQARALLDERAQELEAANVLIAEQSEALLRQSQHFLQRVLDAEPGAVYIYDLIEKRNIYANREIMESYGYSADELMAANILNRILHPDDMPRLMAHFTRLAAAEDGDILDFEYCVYTKTGELRWIHSRDTAFSRSVDGRVTQILGIAQDISARKAAEAEREHLIQELENRNAELERFTYTVSHDLKSPLITIRGFVGYLEQDIQAGATQQVLADIAHIREASDKMRRLLDELLELSRVGRRMNPPQEVPLADLVNEALQLVAGRMMARDVRVTVQPDLPTIYGDRARLVEVLQNLLDNAIKYMGDQPAPQIWVGVRQQGEQPVYFVQDNGMGIAPSYHEAIFNLFEKLEADTEGTGVGLALVKRIIEVHQGTVWVESELGQGATFCFTLGDPRPPGE